MKKKMSADIYLLLEIFDLVEERELKEAGLIPRNRRMQSVFDEAQQYGSIMNLI